MARLVIYPDRDKNRLSRTVMETISSELVVPYRNETFLVSRVRVTIIPVIVVIFLPTVFSIMVPNLTPLTNYWTVIRGIPVMTDSRQVL